MTDELDFSTTESLSSNEVLSSNDKLSRLSWLNKKILSSGDFYFFQDGKLSKILFNEIISCYIDGHYIAVIALGFAFIESGIAGRLSHVGIEKPENMRSVELLLKAKELGWISEIEHNDLTELRLLRNSTMHYQDALNLKRLEVRAIVRSISSEKLLKKDSRLVLESAIKMLSKTAI